MSRRALVCVLVFATAQALSVEKSERFTRFMTGAGSMYDRPRLTRHLNKSKEHITPPEKPLAFTGEGNDESISASTEDIDELPPAPAPSGFKANGQLRRESDAPSTVQNHSFGVELKGMMSRNGEDVTSEPNIVHPTTDSDQKYDNLTTLNKLRREEISMKFVEQQDGVTRLSQNSTEEDVEKRTHLNNEKTSNLTKITELVKRIDNNEWDPINVYSFPPTTRNLGENSTSKEDKGANYHITHSKAQYKKDHSSDKMNLGEVPIVRTNFLEWPIYVFPFPEIKTQLTKKKSPVEPNDEKYNRLGQTYDKYEMLSTQGSFKEDRLEKLGEKGTFPKQRNQNQQIILRKLNKSNKLPFTEEQIAHNKESSNKLHSERKSQERDQPSRLSLLRQETTQRLNKFHNDKITASSGQDDPTKVSLGGTITSQKRGKPYKFIVEQVKSPDFNRRSDNQLIGENSIAKAFNSDIILKTKAMPQNRYGVDNLMVRVETKETIRRSDKLLLGEEVVAREHAKLVHDINALLEYNGWSALRDDETTTEQRDEGDSIYIEDLETRTHPPLAFSTAAPRAPAVNLKIIPKTPPPSKPAVSVPVIVLGGDNVKQPMKPFPTKHPYPFVGAASTTFPMRYRPMMYGYPIRSKPTLWQRFVALFPRIIR